MHHPSLFPTPPHQQLQFVVNEYCNTHLSKRLLLLHYIINRGQPASLARKLVSRVDRLFWLFFDFARPTALLQDRGEEFVRSCSVEKLARWDLSSLHWRLLCVARGDMQRGMLRFCLRCLPFKKLIESFIFENSLSTFECMMVQNLVSEIWMFDFF